MSFAVGSLVHARGREWVVLPDSEDDLLILRPLGGTDDEVAGIYLPLEDVKAAAFGLPDPARIGDHRSCRLLYEAARLGLRSSAGPFRAFGRIAVEPRPYQLVPLLMALKQDPVRLLIADDVGIGKTIEAALIAKELLERGDAHRLAILCPPHLAEQWQAELRDKFHIDAELVLASTAARLERACQLGQSLFDIHPIVIVSTDFIKTDRRRDEFVRSAPELVIVDEAHTCASGQAGRRNHQRHELLRGLAAKPQQQLILVTATPHSGNEDAFRSLLGLLDPSLAQLPADLSGPENVKNRRKLAEYLVQRRRGDIRHFMKEETPFPERDPLEITYELSANYKRLFERVLDYARESVADSTGGLRHQRVRWWSALALLRSLASSPRAAAATLRNRSETADAETPEEVDEIGLRSVLDADPDTFVEGIDVVAGGDSGDEPDVPEESAHRRLLELARQAEGITPAQDKKLTCAVETVKGLLAKGHRPIVFCRFIPTADYVTEELRKKLGRGVAVESVTGVLPPDEREQRVRALGEADARVLVCTDCLSEGINLQGQFDAVVHYDLSWNPTRHEQREGRVDRFGQKRPTVRVVTIYGEDNQIDGIVLDVLLRKHQSIRSALGVSVPVPADARAVTKAVFEGLLLRGKGQGANLYLPGMEGVFQPIKDQLHRDWDLAEQRERRSRTMFAQESLKPEQVARELDEARRAIGGADTVRQFVLNALRAYQVPVDAIGEEAKADLSAAPLALRDRLGVAQSVRLGFTLPVQDGVSFVGRTHPFVEGLAGFVLDTALDAKAGHAVATRCGAIRTNRVSRRTTLLMLRLRHQLSITRTSSTTELLAEECHICAFEGAPEAAQWLTDDEALSLLEATPTENIDADAAGSFVRKVVDGVPAIVAHLSEVAQHRAVTVAEAHARVRGASRQTGGRTTVAPMEPVDVLGVLLLLPA